jgi:hypothetical protein
MNLPRRWSSWVGPLSAGLMAAAGAASLAADDPFAPREGPVVRKAAPEGRPPAKKGRSLLQALADAMAGNDDRKALIVEQRALDDANLRNLEAQVRPQLQQLLYVELALLRRVCNVDGKPFVEVAKGTKAGFRAVVREYAVSQNTRMRGRIVIRGGIEQLPDTIDPRTQVQRLLASLVESKLGPQQAQRYRQECDKRAESRKHAVVLNLVAALDEHLVLTAEQRAGLVQSLSSSYRSDWGQYLRVLAHNMQYLPFIRDESIVPLLNERQKSVWRQVPKLSPGIFWGVHFARVGPGGEAAEIQEIGRIVEEAQDEQ